MNETTENQQLRGQRGASAQQRAKRVTLLAAGANLSAESETLLGLGEKRQLIHAPPHRMPLLSGKIALPRSDAPAGPLAVMSGVECYPVSYILAQKREEAEHEPPSEPNDIWAKLRGGILPDSPQFTLTQEREKLVAAFLSDAGITEIPMLNERPQERRDYTGDDTDDECATTTFKNIKSQEWEVPRAQSEPAMYAGSYEPLLSPESPDSSELYDPSVAISGDYTHDETVVASLLTHLSDGRVERPHKPFRAATPPRESLEPQLLLTVPRWREKPQGQAEPLNSSTGFNTFVLARQMMQPFLRLFHFRTISAVTSLIWADEFKSSVFHYYSLLSWVEHMRQQYEEVDKPKPWKIAVSKWTEERRFLKESTVSAGHEVLLACIYRAIGQALPASIQSSLETLDGMYESFAQTELSYKHDLVKMLLQNDFEDTRKRLLNANLSTDQP